MTKNTGISAMTFLGASLVVILVLIGCREDSTSSDRPPDASPAFPTLTIALIPEHNVFEQRRRYRPLCDYLGKKLGVRVQLKTLPNYGMVCDEFREGRIDAAFLGSFSYVLAHRQVGAQILARPQYKDGGTTYRAYIVARKDSTIKNAEGIHRGRYAFVNPLTTAGFLFELSALSIRPPDIPSIFAEHFFAGSHDASARAVFEGRADCGGCKDRVFRQLAMEIPGFGEEMQVLTESLPVPSNGLAVSGNWPTERREHLRQILLSLHQDLESAEARELLGIDRFVLTRDEDYAPVLDMAARIGIDLTTFRGSLP